VTFSEGATVLAANVPVTGTDTGFSISTLSVGAHTITATYSGTSTIQPATYTRTFTVAPRTLHVTATAANKVYDSTTGTYVTLQDDRLAGDLLTVSAIAGVFDDPHVGTAKTVTVSGLSLSGPDAGNYVPASTTVFTTADVTEATPVFTDLSASSAIVAGASSVTLSGRIAASGAYPPGDVTIQIGALAQTATISPVNGAFSIAFPTDSLAPSGVPYVITYSYDASDNGTADFLDAGDSSTTLSVNARSFVLQATYNTTTFMGMTTGTINLVDLKTPTPLRPRPRTPRRSTGETAWWRPASRSPMPPPTARRSMSSARTRTTSAASISRSSPCSTRTGRAWGPRRARPRALRWGRSLPEG
jgi:hypothetical protein